MSPWEHCKYITKNPLSNPADIGYITDPDDLFELNNVP